MTIVSVPKDVWTLVVTASADTIVENLGHSEVYISNSVPTLTSFPKEKLTITTAVNGDAVYIYSVGKDTDINYFAVGGGGGVADGDKGDITVSGTGATWTIDNNAVTLAKMADMATASLIYRKTAGTGDPEVQSLATLKADLGLTGTNSGDQTITLTGDVTGSGTSSFAATIANDAVTLAKMANIATSSLIYRKTAGTGDPEVQTLATLKADLGLTGTNSGDQTITLTGAVTGSGTGSFATTLSDGTVTTNKFRDSNGYSVIGRQDATVGKPDDIIASSANTVLVRPNSGTLQFGSIQTTYIDNDAVTNTKLANMATSTIKGRSTAGTGDPEDLTATQVRTLINVADGANAYTHPNHSGDVTSSGDGATTIAAGVVTNSKLASVPEFTIKGRNTVGTGDPDDLTASSIRTMLNVEDGAQVNVGTNLSYTAGSRLLESSTGSDVTLPLFSASNDGLTPTSGGGSVNFLRADGTWNSPPDTNLTYTASTRILASSTGTDATLPLVTSTEAGLAPLSGGGTTNFLRADGTWAAPPAGGSLALTDLTDVTVSSAAQGQVLVRGASEFQNLMHVTMCIGPFFINDLPATATTEATQAYFNTATAVSRSTINVAMPKNGKVIGIIMSSDANRTAGNATARVKVGGTGFAFDGGSVILNATDVNRVAKMVSYANGVSFVAGNAISPEVSSSGWAPTTANLAIFLIVQFEPF